MQALIQSDYVTSYFIWTTKAFRKLF